MSIKCPVPRINRSKRKVYLYTKGDYEGFDSALAAIDWKTLLNKNSIEESWEIFKREYQRLVEIFIPHKMVRPGARHKPPWSRYKSVEKARQKKRAQWVKSKQSGLYSDKLLFEEEVSNMDHTIKKAKAHFEEKLVERIKDDPKAFWNYTRHFTKTKSTIDILVNEGSQVTEDEAKAEILNDFFTSVLIKEPPMDFNYSAPNVKNLLLDFNITPNDVRQKLMRLKANKSSGPDDISINILRQCLNFDVPLTMLFNQSLQTSSLPQDWRDANVTPLHKKGAQTAANNYRPVSLTSQVVKLMERLVLDHLLDICKQNKLLSCDQHGFQEGCSCVTQLLECINIWT